MTFLFPLFLLSYIFLHYSPKFVPFRERNPYPCCSDTEPNKMKMHETKRKKKGWGIMTDFNRYTNPQIQLWDMQYSLHLTITKSDRCPASFLWVMRFLVCICVCVFVHECVCFSIHLVVSNNKGRAGGWAPAAISVTHMCASISSSVSPVTWANYERRLILVRF